MGSWHTSMQVVGPIFEAIERISEAALATLKTCSDQLFVGCQQEFSALQVNCL